MICYKTTAGEGRVRGGTSSRRSPSPSAFLSVVECSFTSGSSTNFTPRDRCSALASACSAAATTGALGVSEGVDMARTRWGGMGGGGGTGLQLGLKVKRSCE
jgi:hypothetical protein